MAEQEQNQSNLILALAARRPGLEAFDADWRLIEDVLQGRIKRRAPASASGFYDPHARGWTSPYLPKGRLEADAEYALRVELTPFFPQTPRVMASRLGALLRVSPQIEGVSDPKWRAFLDRAGRHHARFEDLLSQAACLVETYGFCAALLDRDPLPLDARAREASVAEADERAFGRPYLTLYAAPDILDWQYGADGQLAWVKLAERERVRARWDAPLRETIVYRIADRETIRVFRVSRDTNGQWQLAAEAPVPHGLGRVPVVFVHPFPGPDGIGRPMLARAAEADIAATRVLSDLVWDLFLLGNPILVLKSERGEAELKRLGLGASRYVPLKSGRPGLENPEDLKFVQLDSTGIEMLFRAHGLFSAQVAKQAGASASEAAASVREQSGVARAWAFKTGEERHLFVLARALETFLSRGLELAAAALEVDDHPLVRLPEKFDISGPEETVALSEKIFALAERTGLDELAKIALARAESALGVLTPEQRAALEEERAKLKLDGEKS